MTTTRALALTVLLAFGGGCAIFTPGPVTRRLHNRTSEGRFVDEGAYEAYGEGAIAEATGDHAAAERAYLRSLALDPASEDAWTRVLALRCARGELIGARDAFQRATELDPEYAPAFFERARCGLTNGDLDGARRDAVQAVALDPASVAASLLVAEIADRRGDRAEAERYRYGARARGAADEAAARALVAREPRRSKATTTDVDRALLAGDVAYARAAAISGGVTPGALALRAVALGNAPFAREQARLVLAASPGDADARVALLAAADLLGDAASFAMALSDLPARGEPPSTLGRLLLAEVLRRRIGPDAVPPEPSAPAPQASDALIERVRTRADRSR